MKHWITMAVILLVGILPFSGQCDGYEPSHKVPNFKIDERSAYDMFWDAAKNDFKPELRLDVMEYREQTHYFELELDFDNAELRKGNFDFNEVFEGVTLQYRIKF